MVKQHKMVHLLMSSIGVISSPFSSPEATYSYRTRRSNNNFKLDYNKQPPGQPKRCSPEACTILSSQTMYPLKVLRSQTSLTHQPFPCICPTLYKHRRNLRACTLAFTHTQFVCWARGAWVDYIDTSTKAKEQQKVCMCVCVYDFA